MKVILLTALLAPTLSSAGSLYQCQGGDGSLSFQDKPCEAGSITMDAPKSKPTNSEFTNEMVRTLARLTGKSENELNDPELRKAAEALAATDAAKSYAFTQVYGVSSRYCGAPVSDDLSNYKAKAAEIIALGKYYYTNGIHVEIKGKKISKTGKELTDGLNSMLSNLEKEHQDLSQEKLKRKCREASNALRSLAELYSS